MTLDNDGIRSLKRAGILFLVVLFLYITGFGGCMAYRERGKPWVVIQTVDSNKVPVVVIEHTLRLTNGPVTLSFPGENPGDPSSISRYTRVFRGPNTNAMPFGVVEFVDTTFLPGTIAFDAFGHLVELQPRALFVDGHELPWVSGTNLTVRAADKLPKERRPRH